MATIYYHDTGDYLSRDEKLKRIRTNHYRLQHRCHSLLSC